MKNWQKQRRDESLKSEESDQELSSGGGSGDTVIASENIEEDDLDFTIKNPMMYCRIFMLIDRL